MSALLTRGLGLTPYHLVLRGLSSSTIPPVVSGTYTYPALATLGSGRVGLTGSIGYRLVDMGGSIVTPFTTVDVVETGIAGDYFVAGGMAIPLGFSGRIVWGLSGIDLQEFAIGPGTYENLLKVGGAGAKAFSMIVQDTNNRPLGNVEVWVSTDQLGSNIVAGTLLTDNTGKVTFLLDPGDYYLWREHPEFTFTNPQLFTVPV
jgi:hypothetical protein